MCEPQDSTSCSILQLPYLSKLQGIQEILKHVERVPLSLYSCPHEDLPVLLLATTAILIRLSRLMARRRSFD